MSTDSFLRVQDEPEQKTNYLKKVGVPLAVAGVAGAAALLFAGGKSTTTQSTEMIETPSTDLFSSYDETCSYNWNRIHNSNDPNFLNSSSLSNNLVNGKYEDPDFPADNSSLWWDLQNGGTALQQRNTYIQAHNQAPQGIAWLRPSDIVASSQQPGGANRGHNNPSLFGPKGVQVRTSEQGDLGDCWFLSSATALAEFPDRITSLFHNTEYSPEGAFNIDFHIMGEKVAVHIDDRIPMENYGQGYEAQYLFINNRVSQDGAWWLVLLEKAMAKLNVNYSNINAGRPGEALRALSGMPVVNYQSAQMSDEDLWNTITDGMDNNYAMVGGTGQNPADGVTPGHAETCLGSLVLYNEDGSVREHLIKMRNPWGKYQYDGPWSRNSSEWTPEFKRQADYASADDGIYYTPLRLWRAEFENLAIAHYRDNWHTDEVDGIDSAYQPSAQRPGYYLMNNPEQQDVMVSCEQQTERLWPFTAGNQCSTQEHYPQSYVATVYSEGESNTNNQMSTTPTQINCSGEAFKLDNLAAGQYNIAVWSFGSDQGHSIFKVKTWAVNSRATIRQRQNTTSRIDSYY